MNQHRKIFLSAISGNILEYYDFTVYAVFSISIGKAFFAPDSELAQTLYSLAVFAVGFLTRPIGGIFFGYIGDKYGRKKALIYSMLGMTIPTFVMGIIPNYEEIGYIAPALLVTMRLLQGLCVSGEGVGTAIFVLEHYGDMRPGLTTSTVQSSNIAGTLLASLVGIIIEKYFSHVNEAWRVAFLIGGALGIVGFYLRLKVSETPVFRQLASTKHTLNAPFTHVLKTAWRCVLVTFFLGGMTSSIVYLVKTYVYVFFKGIMNMSPETSLSYVSYTSCILMLTMPCFGMLADKFGKMRVMIFAAIITPMFAIPVMILMSSTYFVTQIIALTCLGILAGSASGVAYIFSISLFAPEQRFTGVAFSYNLGIALFGGTSGMISRWLVDVTSIIYAPAFYIMATSIVFLCVMFLMRHTIHNQLSLTQ